MLHITSNEKAVMGGLVAALYTICVQLHQSGHFTLHEFVIAVMAWVVTHLSIWVTANTTK